MALAWLLLAMPELSRWAFAAVVAGNLLVVATRRPQAAALLTMGFLTVLALARRLLLSQADWTPLDPLLLVGPAVAVFLLVQLYVVERRPLANDRVSRLVLALLALTLLQALNPLGGGLVASFAGLLFLAIPLLWFLVGRAVMTRAGVLGLFRAVVFLAFAVAIYGLVQIRMGLPPWDVAWLETTGYSALNVGDQVRAFGPFSSSAEYAAFLAVGIVAAIALAFPRRPALLLALPVMGIALFLASARGTLLLTLFAVLVFVGLGSGRRWVAVGTVVVGFAVMAATLQLVAPALDRAVSQGGNDLVEHQVEGLSDPLDPDASTLGLHLELVLGGVAEGIRNPLGSGTAATNLAGATFGAGGGTDDASQGTEADFSNAFVSLGLVGGLLFLAMMATVLVATTRLWLLRRDRTVLAVLGVLLVTLGQWQIGGHYAVSPLVWLLIGWISAELGRQREGAEGVVRP